LSAERLVVWHAGRLHREDQPILPATDRAFLYGDAVYETLRTVSGRPLFEAEHLARLRRSASLLTIPCPEELPALRPLVSRASKRLGAVDLRIRITLSRGASGGLLPDPSVPSRLVIHLERFRPRPVSWYRHGIAAWVSRHRRVHPQAVPSIAKSGSFIAHILALAEASGHGCQEALMKNDRNRIVEGAVSNLFVVRRGRIETPPVSEGILPGITRAVVLRLARRLARRLERRLAGRLLLARTNPLTLQRLLHSDEAFLTNSTGGIVPLVRVNNHSIGNGRPGPVTQVLSETYSAYIEAHATTE